MKYYSASFLVAAALTFRVDGLSVVSYKSSQRNHVSTLVPSRLFGMQNPEADVNASVKLSSSKSKRKDAGRKILRPHAPKTPRTSWDESVLEYANQLLDTQQQQDPAAKSPTRRIADEEFYLTKQYIKPLDDDLSVGPKPRLTSIELLRDSKRRAEKLLSRSIFEKEKADEKKRKIRSRMEEELRLVDDKLKEKLDMALMGIEDDVERMQVLINREMILEEERMAQFNILVRNLQSSALAIRQDMAAETKIYHEMRALRTKLDGDSTSARQLDKLIVRKQELLDIESGLLEDLNACSSDTKRAFSDCERRYRSMQAVLDTVCKPVKTLETRDYNWSDIDIMESVLIEAAKDVEQSELSLMSLKNRIDFALQQKDAILRASVTMHHRSNNTTENNKSAILKFTDLQDKDDTDVIKQLAISLGNATYSGSKATAFALKTILDAVSAKEVSLAADLARARTNQVNFGSNETFKETARAALDSIVDTTKVFFEMAAVSDASREAGASVQNVTNELISAANAVSVLSNRAYKKFLGQQLD